MAGWPRGARAAGRAAGTHRVAASADRRPLLPAPAVAGTVDGMTSTASARRDVSDHEMVEATRTVLGLLSGRWNVDVLYLLASGTRRYSELFYEVGEISKKTLTQTLRSLQRDGLVLRRAYAEMPVRVESSLTPLGWSLTGPLMSLYEWAAAELDGVSAAR